MYGGVCKKEVPQTRDGRFYPPMLERCQRSEQALITTLGECYVQGVSTRKVAAICRELSGDDVSHETVSQYTQRRDEELEPWRTRPLEGRYPYVLLDAPYEKVRENHRIVDVAVMVATAVNEEARRALADLAATLEAKRPKLAEWLEIEGEATPTCFHFPAEHRFHQTRNCACH